MQDIFIYIYSDEPRKESDDTQYEVNSMRDREDTIKSTPTPTVDDSVCEEQQTGDIEDIKIVTFNCKNIVTSYIAIEELMNAATFLLVQEHWLLHYQLSLLNDFSMDILGCGKAVDSDNPIPPIQKPRGYGGVAFLWKSHIDHLNEARGMKNSLMGMSGSSVYVLTDSQNR